MKKFICLLLSIFITSFYNVSFAKTVQNQNYRINYLNIPFWNNFNDEILINSLNTVFNNNNDLKATTLKVSESQKLVKMSLANELPHISFNGYINQIFKSSDEVFGDITIPDYTETRFLLPLTMNYEIDIWGKNHLKTKSQKKRLEMVKQDEKSVYIGLTSAFATDYYNLIKIDELIKLQKELIETQKQVVTSMEKKFDAGTVTVHQVLAEKKELTYLIEELHNLQEKQDVVQNQMSVLLADKSFNEIKRTNFKDINAKIIIPEKIKTETLMTRPDCVKSEMNMERVGLDVRVAKRELLPRFDIVGNIGFNAYSLSSAHTFLANLAVAPTWDLFMGGQKIQLLKYHKDEYKIAIEHYDKTILKSIQEANDTIYTLKSMDKKYTIAKDRLALSNKEYKLMQKKAELGTADKLRVLVQKEADILAQKQEVSLKINEILAMINLYQALGGINIFTENL